MVFLGRLADLAGTDSIEFALPDSEITWDVLLAMLVPELAAVAGTDMVKIAVNGAIVPDKSALAARAGDEIALLPPVSGG